VFCIPTWLANFTMLSIAVSTTPSYVGDAGISGRYPNLEALCFVKSFAHNTGTVTYLFTSTSNSCVGTVQAAMQSGGALETC
jgi:hypothetical protein